jgi:hypothetical protein
MKNYFIIFLTVAGSLLLYPPLQWCMGETCVSEGHGWLLNNKHYSIDYGKLAIYLILAAIVIIIAFLLFSRVANQKVKREYLSSNLLSKYQDNRETMSFNSIEDEVISRSKSFIIKSVIDRTMELMENKIPLSAALKFNRDFFDKNPGPVSWVEMELIIKSVYEEGRHESPIFYRWSWFFYLTIFIFPPLGIIIGLTGDIYSKEDGRPVAIPNKDKMLYVGIGSVVVALALLRILAR